MNVLFITEVSPFPVNGGERIRSYGLLKALDNLNYNIMALVGNEDNINFTDYIQQFELKNIIFYKLNYKKNQCKTLNMMQYFLQKNEVLEQISKINLSKIDIVIIDYGFLGQYISYFKNLKIPVIYGTHNAQALLTIQSNTVGILSYFFNSFHVILQLIHERLYFNRSDILLVVSEKDLRYHKKFVSENKIKLIPNFLDENLYDNKYLNKEPYIIMTANFNAFQNRYGLEWFLKNVWDEDLYIKNTLKIVGKGSKGILKDLGISHVKGVEEIGQVESVNEYIAKSKLTIIPLLHGSGTRLKCLESMALQTVIVGTSLGVEGIEHEGSISEANTPEEFKQAILSTLKNTMESNYKAKKAYDVFLKKYSLNSIQAKIATICNNLITKNVR